MANGFKLDDVKQIDRFTSVKNTYFRPSTQRFELRKKPKKRK